MTFGDTYSMTCCDIDNMLLLMLCMRFGDHDIMVFDPCAMMRDTNIMICRDPNIMIPCVERMLGLMLMIDWFPNVSSLIYMHVITSSKEIPYCESIFVHYPCLLYSYNIEEVIFY